VLRDPTPEMLTRLEDRPLAEGRRCAKATMVAEADRAKRHGTGAKTIIEGRRWSWRRRWACLPV